MDDNLPPQNLVLEISPNRQITTRDFRLYVEALAKNNVVDGTDITVKIERDGALKFMAPTPPRLIPKKTAHQKKVEAQLASRREKIDNGEDVPGYVPPVKQKRVIKLPKQRTVAKVSRKTVVVRRARTGGSKDE